MSTSGIRVELAVESPEACPVAAVSAEAGTTVTDVVQSRAGEDGPVVEEFTVADDPVPAGSDAEQLFASANGGRYRIDGDSGTCPCETVESFECPVADVRAESGELLLTFYAPDVDRVRAIVTRMRALYDDVSLQSLQRDGTDGTGDSVLVDRGTLTDRQREVLKTAVEMGYFEYPKGANAGEVADALDISVSTLAEHLAAAQTKLLVPIVEG